MSVYVDEPFVVSRGKRWAHLTADSEEELHAFAQRLGLRRQSFQTSPGKPWKDHYDVTESIRELAIRMGAIAESSAGGVERRRELRRQAVRDRRLDWDHRLGDRRQDLEIGPDGTSARRDDHSGGVGKAGVV